MVFKFKHKGPPNVLFNASNFIKYKILALDYCQDLIIKLVTKPKQQTHQPLISIPMKKSIIFLLLFISSTAVSQAQDVVFPAIQGYGGVQPVPFEVEKPDPSKPYKFVIELGNRLEDKTQVADMLDYAARMYNLLRYGGIPKENIELAIVIYASSTPIVMANPTYLKLFGQENPNGALLDEFLKNGIQIIICGQSMVKQDLLPEDIYPGVRMALSRFTATTDYIEKGYQLITL